MKQFYKNGVIVKSYEKWWICNEEKYMGIGRYITWPLDCLNDKVSLSLRQEAAEKWFGYQDERGWVVPDFDYLQRYIQHCNNLGIKVFCLQIESAENIIISSMNFQNEEYLGYDYVDADMQTSCFYEDISATESCIQESFCQIKQNLNQYGLLDSLDIMNEYLNIREKLIVQGYDMEEYFAPRIVKLSKVCLEI